ncbi:uncharacterized protein K452DRAFT_281766 [Aplosporella prunicola CBS 121167]|uniref:Major facilitator superfamily (MFS) profile domain-containing protein n=1 Tax=Aplosporella prunicola CBS 121167 TaxID=1176127 RepID=A0A6A6ATI2_9PEZI|nr:uncharacterized protein K452DRAFT_281766 [Aplosporella prunicola CBS 121167]KAF2135279.1 hypothetical protein K452DRAFT_281766 [Aplosporella prunicola CBS 121167]
MSHPQQEAKPLAQPPDGGTRAWLVTLGCWCAFFVTFGWINAIGVFQEYYQQHLLRDYSPSTIAWIPACETSMMFAGGLVFGKLFDSYGPVAELLIGSFLHVFGLMMTSLSTEYYQIFLSQAICSAVGSSCVYYACAGSIVTWFERKRSTAFGIAASGSSIGGVVFPIMVFKLIPRVGFPWTMRITAFVVLGLLVVTNLTVRSMITHAPKPFTVREYLLPFRELRFSLLVAAMTMFSFGLFLPFNFLVLQAQSIGMSNDLSEYMIAVLNAASFFGRTLPGPAADRFGRFNVMIVTMVLAGVVVLAAWIPATTNATVIVFAILYGFFSGAYVSLGPTLLAQISDISQIGIRNGSLYFVVSIAALTGNPIAGALENADHGGFTYLQIFAGVTTCVGGLLMLVTRISMTGMKWAVI